MLKFIKKLATQEKTKISLGRWARTNENVKSIYANSDHCGDIICGDPKKMKHIVNFGQQKIKVKLPQNNNFTKENEFCCMLLGMSGGYKKCSFITK